MRATVGSIFSTGTPEVILEHRGDKVSFGVSVFGRAKFNRDFDVFQQINQFWAQLPEPHQAAIFKVYRDIEYGFDSIHAMGDLNEHLYDKVKELIDLHGLENIKDWISFKSDIVIPRDIGTEYVPGTDLSITREKTYIKSDYVQLVALSLILRTMVPVWGHYISCIRQDTGTSYKEYYAFQLLRKSSLINCEPMKRFETYIDHNIKDERNQPSNFMKVISSEDYAYHQLALAVIRRLCLEDIRGTVPGTNLARAMYGYIIGKVRNPDSSAESNVREKKLDSNERAADQKISTWEVYKISSNISDAEIVEIQVSMQQFHDQIIEMGGTTEQVMRLSMYTDGPTLLRSLRTSKALESERLSQPQLAILRWLLKPIVSPRGILYLQNGQNQIGSLAVMIGVAEAVLWARGHKYLALMVSSYASVSDREMLISPMDSKNRIPKELLERIDTAFPFSKLPESKKNGGRSMNRVEQTINLTTDNLAMFSWKTTADEKMVQEVLGTYTKKFPIRSDIKTHLAMLAIEIGERSWL
jgi:hypothetical protein